MAETLAIVTFLFKAPKKWRELLYEPYAPRHVNALWQACKDNIRIPHRFIAITDQAKGIKCERRPSFTQVRVRHPDGKTQEDGCYQRLRLYDPEIQAEIGADHILILDLDTVFMGDCTELIESCMEHDFTALRGSHWPDGSLCSWYNGSFQMCRAGARPQFWHDFDTKRFYMQREEYKMPNGKRPHGTDQAWLSVCAGPGERVLTAEDGVYQYRNIRDEMPDKARLIFFAGREKPWMLSVVRENLPVAERWLQYADRRD